MMFSSMLEREENICRFAGDKEFPFQYLLSVGNVFANLVVTDNIMCVLSHFSAGK